MVDQCFLNGEIPPKSPRVSRLNWPNLLWDDWGPSNIFGYIGKLHIEGGQSFMPVPLVKNRVVRWGNRTIFRKNHPKYSGQRPWPNMAMKDPLCVDRSCDITLRPHQKVLFQCRAYFSWSPGGELVNHGKSKSRLYPGTQFLPFGSICGALKAVQRLAL